jgi:hypothetical protein
MGFKDRLKKQVDPSVRGMIEIHVEPLKGGGWVIKSVDTGKWLTKSPFVRKRDAESAAREVLMDKGGGIAVIHRYSGEVEERDTVPARRVQGPPPVSAGP